MTVVFFEGRLGWYWRLLARNGKVVAIGGEPFKRVSSARRSWRKLCRDISGVYGQSYIDAIKEVVDPTPPLQHTPTEGAP